MAFVPEEARWGAGAEIGGGVAALYAHALAIEREAAARYGEFAARMADEGNEAVARLFAELAGFEGEHASALERECDGMALPAIAPAEYAWLDAGAPETAAHDLVFQLMTRTTHSRSRSPQSCARRPSSSR